MMVTIPVAIVGGTPAWREQVAQEAWAILHDKTDKEFEGGVVREAPDFFGEGWGDSLSGVFVNHNMELSVQRAMNDRLLGESEHCEAGILFSNENAFTAYCDLALYAVDMSEHEPEHQDASVMLALQLAAIYITRYVGGFHLGGVFYHQNDSTASQVMQGFAEVGIPSVFVDKEVRPAAERIVGVLLESFGWGGEDAPSEETAQGTDQAEA